MRKKKYNVKAVIFDMDGVITDTMPYHYRAWKKVFASVGVNVTRQDVYQREGQRGLTSIKGMCQDKGISITTKTAKDLLRKKEKMFKKIFKQRFILGSRSFISVLARKGFMLALVTGTSLSEMLQMLPQTIKDRFSVIITGCDVRQGKPHPEPFLKALKKLNISAEQAVVIENAPLGIASAKKAGLTCLALETSLSKEFLSQADRVFDSFNDLASQLKFQYTP
jgi:beta-phosphoglucomutase